MSSYFILGQRSSHKSDPKTNDVSGTISNCSDISFMQRYSVHEWNFITDAWAV